MTFLSNIKKSENTIDTFGGYNSNARIGENEFADMKNLTGDHFPVLASRKQRGIYKVGTSVRGMINKDALCYVDDGKLYINQYAVEGLALTDTEDKQLVSMGAYLIIFPDKKYINTKDLTDFGSIDATFETSTTVTYTLCRPDATAYSGATVSSTEPAHPDNGDLWIDTSETPHILKQYSSSSAVWTEIVSTYIKISATNIASSFQEGDAVSISGSDVINGDGIYIESAHHGIDGAGDYIVVPGIIDEVTSQISPVTVSRKMPKVDFVIEGNNRLWGCRYGTDNSNNVVNEIYACKLGDFKNWNCFEGLASDSYAASLGSDGAFTGAITYKGYPMFFKEECLHKIYGDFPENYQINTVACDGVQKGSYKSLAIVDSVLYYKSHSGIYAYDGSLPAKVSYAVEDGYTNAAAGGIGSKYYVSMKKNNVWTLFVYDTSKRMWYKEDNAQARDFCQMENELYMTVSNTIYTVNGSGTPITETVDGNATPVPVEWSFESGMLGIETPNRKYLSSVIIRLHLSGTAKAYVKYDNGSWVETNSISGSALTYNLMIKLKRCDFFRIKIAGSGDFKLYSLTKIIHSGSSKV